MMMRVMAVPRKYTDELRERAVRLAVDAGVILRRGPARYLGSASR